MAAFVNVTILTPPTQVGYWAPGTGLVKPKFDIVEHQLYEAQLSTYRSTIYTWYTNYAKQQPVHQSSCHRRAAKASA
jgi:hypothetical protein